MISKELLNQEPTEGKPSQHETVSSALNDLTQVANGIKNVLQQGKDVMTVSPVFDQVIQAAQQSMEQMLNQLIPVMRKHYSEYTGQLVELSTTFRGTLQLFVDVMD